MTDKTQDWRTMTAGRELDEEIAARLGWHTEVTSNNRRAWLDAQGYERALPDWSSNTDAALYLVKDLCADIFINPDNNYGCEVGNTKFRFDFNLCFRRHIGTGDTVALAVCRAWLAMQDELAK